MKIIHCADLHLDSSMTSSLSAEQARERRYEILGTFRKMVEYAVEQKAAAILISGDLYDKKNISVTARNTILSAIKDHPDIRFYYLRGNHDSDTVLKAFDKLPDNLFLFNDQSWRTWICSGPDSDDQAAITGIELNDRNVSASLDSLVLDNGKYNIVMLHGNVTDSYGGSSGNSGKKGTAITLRSLHNKGIDYLALGHIHAPSEGKLDSRGTWCYPGCLEGRGFDECGAHGFMLLDIDPVSHECQREFIPMAFRTFHEIQVDCTGFRNSHEVIVGIRRKLDLCSLPEKDLAEIVLTGTIGLDTELNIGFIRKELQNRCYFLKLRDQTTIKIDYDSFAADISLKGEFIRKVRAHAELTEEQKAAVIRHGIGLLMGEVQYED